MFNQLTSQRTVLIFHGVGTPARAMEDGEAKYWLSHDQFCQILDHIVGMGTIAPQITFDDGNASDIEFALPELLSRGLNATFFLLTARLGKPGSLTEADVKALSDQGQKIGLHGHSHCDWRTLAKAERTQEFQTARQQLCTISGKKIDTAAAPFGLYDRQVVAELVKEGFTSLFTSDWGRAPEAAFIQNRNCIDYTMTTRDIQHALRGHVSLKRWPRRALGLAKKRLFPIRLTS
jgi:peptidoglycan/xylan/chitin deacetylase (PgdA/CDA1 family)